MGRTKKGKVSTVSTTISNRITRMSSIASIQMDTCGQSSTPKKNVNRKQIYEQFRREEKKNQAAFLSMLDADIEEFKTACAMYKLSIPVKILNKPLKQFKHYKKEFAVDTIENEVSSDENCATVANMNVSEDGLDFKKPLLPTSNTKSVRKQSKNASKLYTPFNRQMRTPNVITPKINYNLPVSVLRHARIGEQAVSLSGSPIMVSSVPRDDTATVSVPFHDGRVFTILPSVEFQPDQMPVLNNETRSQLQTLYKNLAALFSESDSIDEGDETVDN